MKSHQEKYYEIEKILKRELKSNVKINIENGNTWLEVNESDFWIKCNEIEMTVGFRELHGHFSDVYENLDKGIARIYNLLTNNIRITEYIKGKSIFKFIGEFELEKNKYEEFGSSLLIFYPFWKKTKIKAINYNKLVEGYKIESDFKKLC